MDRITKAILFFLGISIMIIALLILTVERVPVRTYGVRQVIWGNGGIDPVDYEVGYHLGITGIHKWHLLDASTHFLEFVSTGQREGLDGARGSLTLFPKSGGPSDLETPAYYYYPALEIRNRDGNIVTIDASIPYRILKGEAHKIVADGQKGFYQERVKATVESALREVLPEMSNEGFQDTKTRLEICAKALLELNKELQKFHVEAEAVLIRRVSFPPEYEAKLQQKQLFTQKARLDQAETLKLAEVLKTGTIEKEIAAAEALSLANWGKKLETLRSEYMLQVATINAEATQYSKKTRAEGDATYQTKIADGKLAIDKSEALLSQLRSEALSTAGGRIYVALQAAENLNISKVTLNSTDPRVPLVLDIHQFAEMLIGTTAAPPPAK
jgi:regulator of protease activity HflC (stomatin/prohibitin superfamily)